MLFAAVVVAVFGCGTNTTTELRNLRLFDSNKSLRLFEFRGVVFAFFFQAGHPLFRPSRDANCLV